MEKYYDDSGRVAVLVSSGFGAGWSTWAGGDSSFYAMDKTLVEMKLNKSPASEVASYCEKMQGDEPYMGGWDDVEIEWLECGESFTIEEYDGSESLRTMSDLSMTA